ncbi:solute carrier family 35 member G1-like [Amphiura filiformis]|uniref:solute carrier family 35 member G1-like n=1 Tax=Amphiura filiformis TaxID=82378 RepID=UPI003B221F8D
MDALSSDEELLDFTSNQTRLVLNSSSDDELINIAPDPEAEQRQNNANNENTELTKYQKCFRRFTSHIGLFYAFISSVFFAITTIFVKMLTGKVNSAEILFWRFLFTVILIIPPLVYTRPVILVAKKQLFLLLLRTVAGATAIGLLYSACQMTAVGDANAIFFCNPIFTVIFACILLKEGCSIWDVLLCILSICGVFLVTRPPFIFHNKNKEEDSNKGQLLGSLLALSGALFAAITFITLRKIGKSVHYLTTVFYYALFTTILTAILISSLQWWTLPNCGR